jgi:adenylyltransferase/sulfurtransferase
MAIQDPYRERYARQLALDVVGEDGQRRLSEATVAVVGAGALGSNSAELLVRMGVGHVRLIDRDVVETHNLHRLRVLGDEHVGQSKATALAEVLEGLLVDANVEAVPEDMVAGNALALLEGADVVLDGLDNMDGRYLLNDACLELGVPWVYAGVVSTGGLVAPFPAGGPCLRCMFPEPPSPGLLPTCESAGILPSAPALVAAVQVSLASRFILGEVVPARMLALDLWSDDWRTVDFDRRAECPACVGGEREFLMAKDGEMVSTLCGQEAVQINPGRTARIDMEAKAREWAAYGEVSISGPVLTLDLGDTRLLLFPSGRALVKGTAEASVAKSLYARFVGH